VLDCKKIEQEGWVREESGGNKIEEVRQIHSKVTTLLYGTTINPAKKENPFASM
jgi:hypothetical protein